MKADKESATVKVLLIYIKDEKTEAGNDVWRHRTPGVFACGGSMCVLGENRWTDRDRGRRNG